MTEPDQPQRLDSLVAEVTPAAPAAEAAPVAAVKTAPRVALEGDELIQFTIKPSLWFIGIVASRWLAVLVLLGVGLSIAIRGQWSWQSALILQLLITVAAIRLAVATLQWASRVYVLTNRRVMCFRGVLNVEVAECPLTRIGGVLRFTTGLQRALRLGSLRITPAGAPAPPLDWSHVAHPADVHERLLRAIRRAQNGDA